MLDVELELVVFERGQALDEGEEGGAPGHLAAGDVEEEPTHCEMGGVLDQEVRQGEAVLSDQGG
jgi:hypothetical protein